MDEIPTRYLEYYLQTLNDLLEDGSLKAILEGKITDATNWRDLFIIIDSRSTIEIYYGCWEK